MNDIKNLLKTIIKVCFNLLIAFLLVLIIGALSSHLYNYAEADIQVGKSTGTLEMDPAHISIGGHTAVQEIHIYDSGTLKKVWEDTDNPTITAFSVAPTTIDLDTRATGTITFTIGVTGIAGGNTYAQIVRLPGGTNIGTTFTAGAGADINTTLPNITQPQQTTTYRLFAHNSAGAAHKDASVVVTKNPTLTNCRRTGYVDATTLYQFGFTLTGLPRPSVTYRFSRGQQGTVALSHYTQGSNPYTWTIDGWRINFASSTAQSLTLTATNASGSATCTISNIND